MLGLKLPTDPRWADIAEKNIEEILIDHAWCEQKAATNAITIITHNSEYEDLVTSLLELAKEELDHFQMVHEIIKQRGYTLGPKRKDHYVNQLFEFMLLDSFDALSPSYDNPLSLRKSLRIVQHFSKEITRTSKAPKIINGIRK